MFDVNIVIVNFKMKNDVKQCLPGLFTDIKESGLSCNVCVIDNSNNSDGLKEFLNSNFPAVYYRNLRANVGFGKAQNVGLRTAFARYAFVLNPDTVFLAGQSVLRKMFDFMENNPAVGIMGPKLLNMDNSLQHSCYRFPPFWVQPLRRLRLSNLKIFQKQVDKFLMKDFSHEIIKKVDWLMGSALFIRQRAIEQTGYFDERYFMYFEDCDWCRRMWENNWQVVYNPTIVICHSHRRQSAKIPGFRAVLQDPLTRIHLRSWAQYFWKWKFKKKKYY